MNRRAFLKTSTASTFLAIVSRTWGAPSGPSTLSDDEVLARCDDRIRQCRTSDGVIRVLGQDGKPVADAKLTIEQKRHSFRFGCNFFAFGRAPDAMLEDGYRDRFAAVFNFATLGFYWPYYEPQRGQPIYEYTAGVAAWCREHGIACKGHPLVWDFADPKWLPKSFEEITRLSHERVRDIVTHFRGSIGIWDVVNEPTHLGRFNTRLGEWAISLGATRYVAEHLDIAREANPAATLLVNDYRTDPPFHRILESLRREGKLPFDAIGIQSHMHSGGWPLAKVWEVCDAYADFARPIHFTETTVVSGPRKGPGENWGPTDAAGEATQAEYVPKFYTALFAHPAVEAITWWDFSDRAAWQRAAAGWVRADMSPKPVYNRMHALIRDKWWTRASGRTDERGEWRTRAFHGAHRVQAELPDGGTATREVEWRPRQANHFDLIAG